MRLLFAVTLLLLFGYSENAHACTNPAGTEGQQIYNTTHKTMQFCDGTDWWDMKRSVAGASAGTFGDCTDLPGRLCVDNTIYAGRDPKTGNALYVSNVADTSNYSWGPSGVDETGSEDRLDGAANQAWILANRAITSYPAFNACKLLNDSSHLGHTDWFLPALHQVGLLQKNGGLIGTLAQGDNVWASNQTGATNATKIHMLSAVQSANTKADSGNLRVICVRSD